MTRWLGRRLAASLGRSRATTRGTTRGAAGGEAGSASLEFVVLALVLLVPVTYLVVTLGRLQAGSYAAAAGSRAAARAFVTADTAQEAPGRAQAALDLALADQGFTDADATAATDCERPGCLVPEGAVQVTVRVLVPLPFVPPLLRSAVPAALPVEASGVAVVDRFARLRAVP